MVDSYIGLGVPICTDSYIQNFVKDKCQAIMEDVDKLDNIQDDFIHYQLIHFCHATRLPAASQDDMSQSEKAKVQEEA